MIERPKFKSHLHAEVLKPDLVFLLHETGYFVLRGRLYPLLAPLLNGRNTVADIAQQLEGRATALDVHFGLSLLEEDGYIVEASEDEPAGLAAFCNHLNVDFNALETHLKTTAVSVRSFGSVPAAPLISILESLHIRVVEDGDFGVVLVDDYLREELDDYNRQAIKLKRPWMILKPVGIVLWVGPIFHSPKTGCWACLAKRLKENRPEQAFLLARKSKNAEFLSLSVAALPSTFQTALNIAATETFKWVIQKGNQELEGELVTLDVESMNSQKHALTRREDCACCRGPEKDPKTAPVPLVLESRKKVFTSDGGHRSAPPEVVFEKYACHISPITGIVDKVAAQHTEENGLVHVYGAGHNFTLENDPRRILRKGLRRKSAGKGMGLLQAKTSALCEALERYSGVFRGDEIRRKASYRSLGSSAIHPNACMNFSQKQYQDREEWNKREADYNWIPEPFDEEREIEWTPVWSLTEKVFKYVPTAYCYYAYPFSAEHDFCRPDSNGNAAGSNLEEAILQGFLELVERDCVALWWYSGARRPAVDLDSFKQAYFGVLKDHYRTHDRDIQVLDITNDFNIPAFVAVSRGTNPEKQEFIFGFGAHFDPQVAIARALTEMNQALLSVLAGQASSAFSGELLDDAFLIPDAAAGTKKLADFPRLWSDDLRDDVMLCVKLAHARGLEALVLDQTRADVGLCVVKVIVPGMRQFWDRFGPGRLYEVPVRIGWVKTRLTEDQLNPAHLSI